MNNMIIEELYNRHTVGLIATSNARTYGTCFVARLRECIYLITDCHVLYCRRTEDLYDKSFSIRFTHQESGKDDGLFVALELQKEDVVYDVDMDIAIINLSGLDEDKCQFACGTIDDLLPLPIEMFDISTRWAKDAFVVGYPHSLGLDKPFDSKPTMSKGIVSSIDSDKGHFIVDTPSIYGLSGSPVITLEGDAVLLIGIVQKLFPFNAQWFSKNEPGISRSDWHNSGYTKCLSATRIKNFIENHEGAN